MSKKTNTLLFILGATVFNVLTTIISFVLLLIAFNQILVLTGTADESAGSWGIIIVFIGAIALSFFTYRLVLRQIMKKVDMDKHFDPLFGPRRPPRKLD